MIMMLKLLKYLTFENSIPQGMVLMSLKLRVQFFLMVHRRLPSSIVPYPMTSGSW